MKTGNGEQVRWPWALRVLLLLGTFVIVAPWLVVAVAHRVSSRVPAHVGLMTLLLVSSFGAALFLGGVILKLLVDHWTE